MRDSIKPGGRYDSTRQTWERIWGAASVERELQAAQSARAQQLQRAYTAYLPKDAPILEAGSGLSAVVITLRRAGFNAVGMDYALNALRISREYDPALPLYAGDVHALPHANNSLGAYLSFGVLEHFEHGMGPALAEACRVLRPGGVLVLTIPYPNLVHRLVAWRRKLQGKSLLSDDGFYESTCTRRELADNVTRAGFEIVRIAPTSHSFTLWGLGGPFRRPGYYETSALAELLGGLLRVILPWPLNFTTLVIARKPGRP